MLAIKNLRVIDGTGSAPMGCATLIIEDGRILNVGRDIAIPDEASVINAAGLTAIPGLIDMHAHMGGSSSFDHPGAGTRTETYNYVEAREGFLRWGVTTVRTCGDFSDEMLAFRNEVKDGKILSPRIISCGPFIQHPEGHPWATVYMKNPDVAEKACVFADAGKSIEEQVSDIALAGADFIKVFYAHLNKMDYPNPVPRITKDQLSRIVDAAHLHGLKCACHADGPEELLDAVEVGVDIIEHMIGAGSECSEFSAEQIEKIKAGGVTVDPTMISILRFDQTPGFRSVWEDLKKAVKQFYDAGIHLTVGCDSGIPFVPFGESLHDEMSCMTEAGIPTEAVLSMATYGNAKALGLDKSIGSIEAGKEADIVLLGSDPICDIANTKDIRLVLQHGKVVYQA